MACLVKHATNSLIPSYIRRGTGGHRDSRRWEIRELIYTYVTPSPPECLCVKTGCNKSHFNISLKVRDKGTRLWPQTTTFEKREKAGMGSKPRPCLSSQGTILISSLLLFMAVSHPSSLVAQSVFSGTPQGSAHLRVCFQDIFPGLRPKSCLSGCVLFSIL